LEAHEGRGTLREANQWFERALAFDPRFARAALLHADRYGHRLIFGPGDRIADLADSTLEEAAQRLAHSYDIAIRYAPDAYDRVVAEIRGAGCSPA
jgi:hypothetical protein